MPNTIKEIYSDQFGFKDTQLNSLARILYHFKFDGVTRDSDPEQSDLDAILNKEVSVKELNELLQKNIFQKIRGTKERQQIDPSDGFSEEVKLQLLKDFEKIGFVEEISPKVDKKYTSVIIFGAAQFGMEARIDDFSDHFIPAMKSKPQEIFILAGEREGWLDYEPLAKEILLARINSTLEEGNKKTPEYLQKEIDDVYEWVKTSDPLQSNITARQRTAAVEHFKTTYDIIFPTETDIAKKIIESRKAQLNGEIIYINAENKINADGSRSRPNTEDTLRAFAKHINSKKAGSPDEFGSILAISNQPFATSQKMAIKNISELSELDIDVVGKATKQNSASFLACELAGSTWRINVKELSTSASPPQRLAKAEASSAIGAQAGRQ
jgi:hypothetical protein